MNHYEAAETAGRKKLKEDLPYLEYDFKAVNSRTDFKAIDPATGQKYTGELKAYIKEEHKRYSWGTPEKTYPDYRIDYSKCLAIEESAKEDNSIPIVVAIFMDKLMVWYLNEFDWKSKPIKSPATSNTENYNKGEVEKVFASLPLDKGYVMKEYE